MNCKLAPSSPVCTIPKANRSSKACKTGSISFASQSQVWNSGISMNNESGACRGRIEALCRATAESLYQVLGIEESVSLDSDIKKAYRKMARMYHPDVSPPERVEENTRRFIMVREAYETLSNPQRRALYDMNLDLVHQHQAMEERDEWRMRWRSQLDELKRRSQNNISRRERIRNQTQT